VAGGKLADTAEYKVGRFTLKPHRQLLDHGAPVPVGRKALDLLSVLAEADGALVTKDELMAAVWPNAIVEDNAIQVHIAALRKVLGGDAELLSTAHGLGYRLAVTDRAAAPQTPPAEAAVEPPAPQVEAAGSERSPFTKPSVAVLPFANLTGDRDRAYLADGVTEEITRSLSRARTLFVVAGGSNAALKGKGAKLRDAARELGVQYLLDGSVRKAGGRLRIAAKLIDPSDGVQLWADRFDEALEEDLFTLQDKVALTVAARVEPAVVGAEMRWVLKHPSDNPSSYELYLRGLRRCRKRDPEEYRIAIEFLSRAIALDPNNRLALALAAHMHSQLDWFGWAEDPEANRARGSELAYRAIMIAGDDGVVLAHAATAIAVLERDPAAADLFARAVALNPASAYTWFLSGLHQAQFGDADTAIAHLQTSLGLEPMAHRSNVVGAMATSLFRKGRFEESVAFAREAIQTANGPGSLLLLAAGCAQLGKASAAVAALTRYRELSNLPVEVCARKLIPHPAEIKLLLDGIAAAEAASPVDQSG
jgi:TolB-like protein/Tfp pilus assembly protein PilF